MNLENVNIEVDSKSNDWEETMKGMSWWHQCTFVEAFYRIHDRGEIPTPTRLNLELRRRPSSNINGRETHLRTQLLEEAGYKKGSNDRWFLP